jgi:hypothetical protein
MAPYVSSTFPASPQAMSKLSPEATQLLKEAVQDPRQTIIVRPADYDDENGVPVDTNGKRFGESDNPESISLWQSALRELEQRRLVDQSGEGTYRVTGEGSRVARLET